METKTCPYCKEEIKIEASKCRYCNEWLEKKVLFKKHALPIIIGLVSFFIVVFGLQSVMEHFMFNEEKFFNNKDSIKILSHDASTDEEGNLFIVGEMKNESKIPWQSITVQADYYDNNNKLIDSGKGYSSEALAPDEKRSFKIRFGKKQKGVEYKEYKVFIQGANNASRF